MTHINRRALLTSGVGICVAACADRIGFAQSTNPSKKKGPPIDDELVRAFVGAAHGDLEKTRTMLDERPTLLNAVWDWGGGDFEAAIGGAGHMGRRDIAQFLIDRGARFDIFVAAMMGKIEIVRGMITAFPASKDSLGPHRITLMAHAKAGGAEAAEVVKYLESLG